MLRGHLVESVSESSVVPDGRLGAARVPPAAFPQVAPSEKVWTLAMLGLCLYTVSVVTVRVPLGDVGVILGAVGVVAQGRAMRFPAPVLLLAVFVGWAWLTAFFSDFATLALDRTIELIKLLVILVVAVNALRTKKQIRYYLWLYLICFMLSPARGALGGYAVGYTVFGRAVWNYNYHNPNDLAAYSMLAFGIALSLATSLREPRLLRVIAWFSAVVLTLVIFLTQSRGVMLAAAIAFGPAMLLMVRKHPTALVYGCIAIAAILYFVPPSAFDRFANMKFLMNTETIARADEEGSAAGRYDIAIAAWEMTLARPMMGSGLGTYMPTMARDYPVLGQKDTHNTYLNLSAELGIPGLLLWCLMVASVLGAAYRGRRLAARAGIPAGSAWTEKALIGFLLAGLFGSYAGISYLYLYVGVIWCHSAYLKSQVDWLAKSPLAAR